METTQPAAAEAPTPDVPASRTVRLAAALIDSALLLIAPLLSTIVLMALHHTELAVRTADDYWNVNEPPNHQMAERLLGTGLVGPLAIGLPLLAFLLAQWIGLATSGRTIGHRLCGMKLSPSPRLPIATLRSALWFGIAWALASRMHGPSPLVGRGVVVMFLLLLLDGACSVARCHRTLRDRLFRTRPIATGSDRPLAFQPPRFSPVAFVVAVIGFVLSAIVAVVLQLLVSHVSNLESTDIDVPMLVGGAAIPLGLILTGAFSAFKARRFVVGELAMTSLLIALLAFEGMAWGAIAAPALRQFTSPGLLDWTLYAMGVYFGSIVFLVIGSALGFMVASDEGADWSTRLERLVARRHLRLKLQHWAMLALIASLAPMIVYGLFIWPVLSVRRLLGGHSAAKPLAPTVFMALLTIVGVMFGVMSLNVVLGVMGGFERDLKEKILGTTAHGIVQSYLGNFSDWRDVQGKIMAVPGVAGATPFIYGEVMISTDNSVTGAVIHGVDPETVSRVTDLERSISIKGDGHLSDLTYPERIPRLAKRHAPTGDMDPKDINVHDPPPVPADDDEVLPGIAIGREMAHGINVWVGDRVTVMNPLGELGPQGPIPRSRAFRVAAVFVTGMFEYDSKFAYIDLHEAQKFFRLGDSVSGIELRMTDVDEARPIMRRILTVLGDFPFRAKDWGQMNANLFSALRLERVVMFVLLSFQVLIACICVIATLVMLVIEKRKEVATLKAMGAREGSIMKLFVLEGLIIGGIGVFYGSAAGFLFCKLIEKFGVGLNPEIYYIDKLPVVIEPMAFFSVAAVAMVLVFVATIYPARRGGSIAPVEGFREE